MRITSARTGTVLDLVDGALGRDFVPSPPRSVRQRFDSYDVQGGPTRYVMNGGQRSEVSPTNLVIAQANDLLSQQLYRSLDALVFDMTEQPFHILWDPTLASDDDGYFWISDLSVPEMSTDWDGWLDFTAQIIPATPADVGPGSITVRHNGVLVGTLSVLRITVS